MSIFARLTFVPSLAYNLARNRWSNWNWYDRIDDRVVLGALPFHGAITYNLLVNEQIRSVISMNEDFELRFSVTSRQEWLHLGVDFLQLSTSDIFHAPSQEKIRQGLKFIRSKHNSISQNSDYLLADRRYRVLHDQNSLLLLWGKWPMKQNKTVLHGLPFHLNSSPFHQRENSKMNSVYIHCKAGRTRSATLVACYLIKRYNLTPCEAIRELQQRRPQVLLHTKQLEAIQFFYEDLLSSHQNDQQTRETEKQKIII